MIYDISIHFFSSIIHDCLRCALLCYFDSRKQKFWFRRLIWGRFRRFPVWNFNCRCFEEIYGLVGNGFPLLLCIAFDLDISNGAHDYSEDRPFSNRRDTIEAVFCIYSFEYNANFTRCLRNSWVMVCGYIDL